MKFGRFELSRARLLRSLGSVHDMLAAAIAFYLSYATAYGFGSLQSVPGLHDKALVFVLIAIAYFYAFSLNRGFWRYASLPDLLAIIKASAMVVGTFAIVLFFLTRGSNVPRSVLPLSFIYMVIAIGGPRVLFRILKEGGYLEKLTPFTTPQQKKSAILYSVNENAESYIRAVRRSDQSDFTIAGIVDDSIAVGNILHGVKIVGRSDKIEHIVGKLRSRGHDLSDIIVTDPQISPSTLSKIIAQANACELSVSRIPDLKRVSKYGQIDIEPKPIAINDLLPRLEFESDPKPIARLAEGKIIFITGAGGSIGSELARQIATFNPKQLIISDVSEYSLYRVDMEIREKFPKLDLSTKIADIRDCDRISDLFAKFSPDVVFHAAALKHVPLVEANVLEGLKTNLIGTRVLADNSLEHGVKTFVMISTDKAVNPTSVMGATKRAAEAYCQSLDIGSDIPSFKTVRFGNVLGSTGSVVPLFSEQIARGGPVTVTHPEIARYFMTIPEAVRLVLHAAGHGEVTGERGKVLALDMGEPVRIADLAIRMIELAGFKPGIDVIIEYSGLRPGEKLFEELFRSDEAGDIRYEHGYMVASPNIVETAVIRKSIDLIADAIAANEVERALELLCHIVPEYDRHADPVERYQSLSADSEQRPQ